MLAVGSFATASFRFSVSCSLHYLPLHCASGHFTHLSITRQEWLIHFISQFQLNTSLRNLGCLTLIRCTLQYLQNLLFVFYINYKHFKHPTVAPFYPLPFVPFSSFATLAFSQHLYLVCFTSSCEVLAPLELYVN